MELSVTYLEGKGRDPEDQRWLDTLSHYREPRVRERSRVDRSGSTTSDVSPSIPYDYWKTPSVTPRRTQSKIFLIQYVGLHVFRLWDTRLKLVTLTIYYTGGKVVGLFGMTLILSTSTNPPSWHSCPSEPTWTITRHREDYYVRPHRQGKEGLERREIGGVY